MTHEELLAMLDVPATRPSDLDVGDATDKVSVERSPTALELDDWSRRRGSEVLQQSDRLRGMFEIPEQVKDLSAPDWQHTPEVQLIESAQLATADFHAAAFEPEPKLAKACKNERIHQYMQNLMETPEFQALHAETQLDETASEIAAASFAEQWVALVKTEQPADDFKSDMQALAAAGRALHSAASDVGSLRDAQEAMGIGGNGANTGSVNTEQLVGMFRRVQGSDALRRICELAGRYRRFAQAQQRKKVLHGCDDVVGVVLDGDFGRLLPSELVQLDDPDLELDVLRRIVERQAMCREYRGLEGQARGPIVVVVDESGSMSGEKIYTAKAMALALAWVARHQRRWCCLVGFSGGTEGNFCVIPPGKPQPTELLEWLEHFFSGGTDMDVPLEVLPKRWHEIGAPAGKTDIIVVTDAICRVPDDMRESFLAFKAREQVKMTTLVLNNEPGDLAAVSDRVHRVSSLSLDEAAVAEALSV